MTFRPLLCLALIATCGCKSTAAPGQSERRPVDARRPDVQACAEALEESTDARRYIDVCRGLWLEPQCRGAWDRAMSKERGDRGEFVIRECMAAYCPDQTSPAPQLCDRRPEEVDLLDPETDWMGLWSSFNAIVLSRDLGLEAGDARGELIARRLLQSLVMSNTEEPESEPTAAQ